MERQNQTSKDGCPAFAAKMIDQLREVEIILGNIPKALDWRSEHVEAVEKSVFGEDESVFSEYHTEVIFSNIVNKLSGEGFEAEDIMGFINRRIGYKGGPKYCNLDEVREAVK